MFQDPNKWLMVLLVLLVGVGPVGSVTAGPHPCAPDTKQGMMAVADGMAHGDHVRRQDTSDTHDLSPPMQDCDGCDKGCCEGGLCSMGHCAGTAAVLQTSITLEFERLTTSDATLTGDRPLAGRLTPPFRPPQT